MDSQQREGSCVWRAAARPQDGRHLRRQLHSDTGNIQTYIWAIYTHVQEKGNIKLASTGYTKGP